MVEGKEPKKETDETDKTKEKEGNTIENANKVIDAANAAAERLERANTETKKLLERQESNKVKEAFGGQSDAGTQQVSEEEKKVKSAKEYLKGSGMESYAFPDEEQK